ncbi:MAG: hypothetical protein A3J46_05660 [Candidatus Yanofskybacteria bacterium RIFCSPHIGHO2_02_FULL_41_11]|uniref:Glyceraldehyde 3-phosphate dehydrogenase catalytic domain-containing protein n=1 Tax=Candidatus Yanofskybacteria bacterium RIFCSPHIGHO2_02_FULL_41_11 TaxID=1802675 RepID=A0A1F8F8Q8_9BACT|nr:MAG: hypothetical protein A3J46_05660 [Candidatus Yanofskybacteria bacterium RIFCSPHIGHO2_02_FULL_41_11]
MGEIGSIALPQIVIFGLSANPPGNNHLKIVRKLIRLFEKVIVIPRGTGLNKPSTLETTPRQRKEISKEGLNKMLAAASTQDEWKYRKILGTTSKQLVSHDIVGCEFGSLADLGMTSVINGHMATIGAWYDNEWGYCSMLINHLYKVARVAGFIG